MDNAVGYIDTGLGLSFMATLQSLAASAPSCPHRHTEQIQKQYKQYDILSPSHTHKYTGTKTVYTYLDAYTRLNLQRTQPRETSWTCSSSLPQLTNTHIISTLNKHTQVVVLVDNLLDLSLTTHDRRVKEKDLATRVSLSVKHTHSHLMQLKLDRLVCGASMLVEEENDEGKNGKKDAKPVNKWKRPLQMFVWYFDYPLFVKIVKYKHR